MSIGKIPDTPQSHLPDLHPTPTHQPNFVNAHSITRVANSPTILKIKSVIYNALSLVTKPFNSSLSDYHKYRARQLETKIHLSSSFMQKEFGNNIKTSGIKLEQTKSYEEFKASHESKPINFSISLKINNGKLNNIVNKIKNIKIPEITTAKVLYSCKLIAMAATRLGWPIYHLYFKTCEFPGRVGSFCMNIGNVREAKSDKDLKAVYDLNKTLQSSDLLQPMKNSDFEGRNLQGVCMGTVLHLFTEYHSEENEKNFHSLEQLSDYSDGAPAEAVANQIIYENMMLSLKGKTAAAVTMRKNGIPLTGTLEGKTKKIQPFFLHEKEKILYEARGLNLEYCTEVPNFKDNVDEDLYKNLFKLQPGTYYLGFSMGGQSHAIGYIKHPDGTAHIFDPNKGSIRCHSNSEDHVNQLKKAINCYQPSTEKNSQLRGINHKIEIKKATPLNRSL